MRNQEAVSNTITVPSGVMQRCCTTKVQVSSCPLRMVRYMEMEKLGVNANQIWERE